MAQREDLAKEIEDILRLKLRERIPAKYEVKVAVVPAGYKQFLEAFVVTDYFRRLDLFERIDFVWETLQSSGLPARKCNKVTKAFCFSEKEAAELDAALPL